MQSIKNIVDSISVGMPEDTKPMNITFVVDESGSTGTAFVPGISVLDKEMSVVYEYILRNINHKYNMFSFETGCMEHLINVMPDEELVNLPALSPKGSTYTHLPLVEINKKLVKPDVVILITDGDTNSSELQLKMEINKFLEKSIRFEIIAVSAKSIDLNIISQAEERRIPGMDLINYLANSVDKLTIYNQYHKDVPYEGAVSSKINKSQLTFMGSQVWGHVHQYLNNLLTKLDEHKGNIIWGIGNMNFKQMLSEIGKLLSVYFVIFPENHFFISSITKKIQETCEIVDMTEERILNIIKYGFNCTKNEKPIMFTNFEQHIKDAIVKKAEFKNAIDNLKIQGTTLNSKKTICMPTNGVCIINHQYHQGLPLTQNLGAYPKSRDQFGNIYFGCDDDVDEQATRIAFRELCSHLGYKDSRGPEPAFYVLNEMSLMFIKGINLDTEHMKELYKLAVIQTSMEAIIAKDKYDGVGLFKQWKAGNILATHYSKPTHYHSQLYKDNKINPLRLEEPIWWALMMSMLGLFEEQKNMYQTALLAKGITDESEFLSYIRETYKDEILGNITLYTIEEQPTSVFTLDNFDLDDEVYILKKHGECNTKTCYSKHEIESYINTSGCVWCRYIPTSDDFDITHINNTNYLETVSKIMTGCSKLYVPIDAAAARSSVFEDNKKILINMIGITGAGKSTTSKKIYDYVTSKGASCLIVSADKWSKKGVKGKQMQSSIQREIRELDSKSTQYKFLIVDICNENGPSSSCFGYDTSEYTTINFYPNLEKTRFDEYQCWCLRNVLSRPMHTETSLYWLNPESAGVSTCIKVHNMKTNGIKKLIGVSSSLSLSEGLTMEQIMNCLSVKAMSYETYLATRDLDDIVVELVKSTGFIL
jgi:hypothetical protein